MTTKEQSLERLIERVKAATGADRHLDALIEVEARRQEAYRVGLNDQQRAHWTATMDGVVYDSATRYDAPAFTASIDAALALVERVCPDLVIKFTRIGDGSGMLQITEAWRSESGDQVVDDMSPLDPMPGALAIILALLIAHKDAQ